MSWQIKQHSWGDEQVPGVALNSLKLIFDDPPYNIGVKYADDVTRDRRNHEDYRAWVTKLIFHQSQLLMPGGTFWWMCPEAHGDFIGPILTNLIGPRVHRVIWYETFAQYQDKSLTSDYRFIFCHQKSGGEPLKLNGDAIRIPSDRQTKYHDKRANPKGRVPGQVWKIRRLQGTSDDHVDWHKAQLPPELLDRIIRGWSNEGDTVMDGFAGSGNMALSAMRNKRNFIGVEQSPTYVQKMRERLTPHMPEL